MRTRYDKLEQVGTIPTSHQTVAQCRRDFLVGNTLKTQLETLPVTLCVSVCVCVVSLLTRSLLRFLEFQSLSERVDSFFIRL